MKHKTVSVDKQVRYQLRKEFKRLAGGLPVDKAALELITRRYMVLKAELRTSQ